MSAPLFVYILLLMTHACGALTSFFFSLLVNLFVFEFDKIN